MLTALILAGPTANTASSHFYASHFQHTTHLTLCTGGSQGQHSTRHPSQRLTSLCMQVGLTFFNTPDTPSATFQRYSSIFFTLLANQLLP